MSRRAKLIVGAVVVLAIATIVALWWTSRASAEEPAAEGQSPDGGPTGTPRARATGSTEEAALLERVRANNVVVEAMP